MFHLGKSINCTEIIESMEYVKYKTSRICWWNKTIELEMIQRSYRCFHFIENIMFMFHILYCLKMPQFSLLLSSSQSWCRSREVCLNKRRKFLVRKTIFPAGQQLQSEIIVLVFVIVIVIYCCFHCYCYFYCYSLLFSLFFFIFWTSVRSFWCGRKSFPLQLDRSRPLFYFLPQDSHSQAGLASCRPTWLNCKMYLSQFDKCFVLNFKMYLS